MKKRYNEIISQLTICTCTICFIICFEFLNIQPRWLNIVVSIIMSLVTSFGVVYFIIGGIVRLVYKNRANEFNLSGTWYIVYYSKFAEDHYLRVGKLVMKQEFEQVEIERISSHSPHIQNDEVVPYKYRDHEISETPSTGQGFAKINTQNKTLAGVYFVTRSSQQTVVGMIHCQIHDKEMNGKYTTTEDSRPNNRPVGGQLMLFREEKDQLDFCNTLIKSSKYN